MRLTSLASALLVVAALTRSAHDAAAQQATNTSGVLRGTVIDQVTRQPIASAKVSVNGTPFGATTKNDGTFYILATIGTYTVTVSASGYAPTEVPNMTVNDNGNALQRSIELSRSGAARQPTAPPPVEQGRVSTSASSGFVVRTFALQTLSPGAAASLLAPYINSVPGGFAGVYEAGGSIKAITVRAPKEVLSTADSVLRIYDAAPPTIALHFKLIAANDSGTHDAAISEIDATLRQMFRFTGYRQIADGTTTISPSTQLNSFDMSFAGGGTDCYLRGIIGASSGLGANLSQYLTISLYANPPAGSAALQGAGVTNGRGLGPGQRLILSTGLNVPIGQTVVIGGATGNDAGRTLILTVRPELVPIKR